ncbi:SUMF1/EgtB/PvdO family nonheme iron enzyme, partial [Streptomyces sp. NPDC000151]|uniref:SUMF1/EgtB/PvdO family nonheme iron enzyme n=1 Tax=Streptomyces sp. NPDC000151 TaxID=3154244 RepID=UPI00332B5B04
MTSASPSGPAPPHAVSVSASTAASPAALRTVRCRPAVPVVVTAVPEPETEAPDHPVTSVSWRDALCYALWRGKRLPTPLE